MNNEAFLRMKLKMSSLNIFSNILNGSISNILNERNYQNTCIITIGYIQNRNHHTTFNFSRKRSW
jgi:hypothetical protein